MTSAANNLPTLVRRACKNKELAKSLLQALNSPALISAKKTSNGLMLVGPGGSMTVHFTLSDHRGSKNDIARLRRLGFLD